MYVRYSRRQIEEEKYAKWGIQRVFSRPALAEKMALSMDSLTRQIKSYLRGRDE